MHESFLLPLASLVFSNFEAQLLDVLDGPRTLTPALLVGILNDLSASETRAHHLFFYVRKLTLYNQSRTDF